MKTNSRQTKMIPQTDAAIGQTAPRKAAPGSSPPRKSPLPTWLVTVVIAAAAFFFWKDSALLHRFAPEDPPKDVPPVTQLHPAVAAKQAELTAEARKKGIAVLITDGLRTSEEQDALYRKGRSESGPVVTDAKGGESYHNYGLAIDFALRTKDGKVIWDMEFDGNRNGKSDWMEVVDIAKHLGFTWGGDWTNFPDYPHLQMDFGYSIRDLKRGKTPPVELTQK